MPTHIPRSSRMRKTHLLSLQLRRPRVFALLRDAPWKGTQKGLKAHWDFCHHAEIPLWLCPIDCCTHKTRKPSKLRSHLEKRHNLRVRKMQELSKLPALVELTQNRDYKDPGNCQPLTTQAASLPVS